jgi:hypothetical protein
MEVKEDVHYVGAGEAVNVPSCCEAGEGWEMVPWLGVSGEMGRMPEELGRVVRSQSLESRLYRSYLIW